MVGADDQSPSLSVVSEAKRIPVTVLDRSGLMDYIRGQVLDNSYRS